MAGIEATYHGSTVKEERKPCSSVFVSTCSSLGLLTGIIHAICDDEDCRRCQHRVEHDPNKTPNSPMSAHKEREYHLFLLNRSKKKAIDILSIPSAPIAEMID